MKAAWFGVLAAGLCVLPAISQNLPASCGPKDQTLSVKTTNGNHPPIQTSTERATLVFINSEAYCLGCGTVNLGIDGTWMGANKGNSYFSVTVAPGERHVCAYLESFQYRFREKVQLTELNVEAGQTYYFTTYVFHASKANVGALDLRPVSPDEGSFLVSQSSQASWAPKAH